MRCEVENKKNTESKLLYEFLKCMGEVGHILDINCGHGLNSKIFYEKGYQVTSYADSDEISKYASEYLGRDVFTEWRKREERNDEYDGIWASPLLIDFDEDVLTEELEKIGGLLKEGGVFYASIKYNNEEVWLNEEKKKDVYYENQIRKIFCENGFDVLNYLITYEGNGVNDKNKWSHIIVKKRIKNDNRERGLMNLLSKYLSAITAVASVLSLAITAMFKMGTYVYYRGMYDAWNIPIEYITVNYENSLFYVLLTLTIVFLLSGVAIVYEKIITVFFQAKELCKRIFGVGSMILLAFLGAYLFVFIYLSVQFPLGEVLRYFKSYPMSVSVLGIMGVLLFFAICLSIEEIKEIVLSIQGAKKKNKSKNTLDWKVKMAIILCFAFAGCIIYMSFFLYKTGESSVLNEGSVSVVSYEQQDYVIVGRYKDEWILKECLLVQNGKQMINYDNYLLEDIKGVSVAFFKLSEPVEKVFVENRIFIESMKELE